MGRPGRVTAIVTLRDESGLDWCGGVKMSIVAGLERHLGDKSPYNLVMFGYGKERRKQRGDPSFCHKDPFTRMESIREGGVGL